MLINTFAVGLYSGTDGAFPKAPSVALRTDGENPS